MTTPFSFFPLLFPATLLHYKGTEGILTKTKKKIQRKIRLENVTSKLVKEEYQVFDVLTTEPRFLVLGLWGGGGGGLMRARYEDTSNEIRLNGSNKY